MRASRTARPARHTARDILLLCSTLDDIYATIRSGRVLCSNEILRSCEKTRFSIFIFDKAKEKLRKRSIFAYESFGVVNLHPTKKKAWKSQSKASTKRYGPSSKNRTLHKSNNTRYERSSTAHATGHALTVVAIRMCCLRCKGCWYRSCDDRRWRGGVKPGSQERSHQLMTIPSRFCFSLLAVTTLANKITKIWSSRKEKPKERKERRAR